MRAGAAVAAGIAVAMLAGCAQPTAPIATIGQLSAAYLDAGGACKDLVEQYSARPSEPVVATCGDATELTVAHDPQQAAEVVTSYRLRDVPVLTQGVWIVADPEVESLQERMGGEIVVLAPAPGPANLSDALTIGHAGPVETAPLEPDAAPVAPQATSGTLVTIAFDPACPYCASFDAANAAALADAVAAGRITIAYRPVALADSIENGFSSSRGVNALACIADAAPAAFPRAVSAILGMQGTVAEGGFTNADLIGLGESAGVDIAKCVTDGEYLSWVRRATARALETPLPDGEPMRGVPTVMVGQSTYAGDVASADEFAAFLAAHAG